MKHLIAAACLVMGVSAAGLLALPAAAQTAQKVDMGLAVGATIPAIAGTTQAGATMPAFSRAATPASCIALAATITSATSGSRTRTWRAPA